MRQVSMEEGHGPSIQSVWARAHPKGYQAYLHNKMLGSKEIAPWIKELKRWPIPGPIGGPYVPSPTPEDTMKLYPQPIKHPPFLPPYPGKTPSWGQNQKTLAYIWEQLKGLEGEAYQIRKAELLKETGYKPTPAEYAIQATGQAFADEVDNPPRYASGGMRSSGWQPLKAGTSKEGLPQSSYKGVRR